MNKARLEQLMHQYFRNTIGADDCMELLQYLRSADPEAIQEVLDLTLPEGDDIPFTSLQSDQLLHRIKEDPRFTQEPLAGNAPVVLKFYKKRWAKFAAAAVLAGCCAVAAYFMNTRGEAPQVKLAAKEQPVNTILPGSNKATLKLAGGDVIVLDSAQNGVLNVSGEDSVQKTGNGQIIYISKAARQTPGPAAINVLATPKGGTYQVTLSDGTKVWLNSASSLTFPATFSSNERRVKLDGEAFFEVAKNKAVPFYVDVKETTVRVYGTQFNIAAYSDEKTVKTTLITGSVQVTKDNAHRMLVPGQQATTVDGSSSISVGVVNVMNAMSWKNGYFVFDDENINAIMTKVSRWYDVSVEYRGTFDKQKFGGSFYRYKSIDELLHYLEKLGSVHFEISGRRIIVMN